MSQRIGRRSSRIINKSRFSRAFTLIQEAAGSRGSDGIWTPGATSSSSLTGSIQPSTDEERLQLPEGERKSEAITVYFRTTDKDAIRPLKVGTSPADSDIIQVDSLQYAVRAVSSWFDFGHVNAICVRLEGQNG